MEPIELPNIVEREKARETREEYRVKYKPRSPYKIKRLLIGQAPPKDNTNHFFYFDWYYKSGDQLYLETLKSILKPYGITPSEDELHRHKKEYLEEFQRRGFYLLDATEYPMDKSNRSYREKRILQGFLGKDGDIDLKTRILSLIPRNVKVKDAPIILISKPLYKVLYHKLEDDFNVINEPIDFPFRPFKVDSFRSAMEIALKESGYPD